MDSSKLPLATIGGALVTVLFCVFTLAAAVRYPGPFSPVNNWLSDLGTATLNPPGCEYFNIGCILTGICLLLFMAGLGAWRVDDKRKMPLLAGRACGTVSAFALMLIGVFDEGTPYHAPLAITFFLLLFLFLALTNFAIWKHPAYQRWAGYYAIAVIVVDIIFIVTMFVFENAPLGEWLSVFGALLWVLLLAYDTYRLEAGAAP